jgi:hypothetical protein
MRVESSVTAVSWIPSEAVEGIAKLPFEMGPTHYDDPPPEVIEDVEAFIKSDGAREANELRAYIEVEDGKITDSGYSGRGHIGSTILRFGKREMDVAAIPMPLIQKDPETGDDWVRFTQTAGGRTGLPTPRTVRRKPFFQIAAPVAWTTLSLTLHADGSVESEVAGASPFPRHWIYDDSGKLFQKVGVVDFKKWYKEAFGQHTPWGNEDSPAFVTAAESSLERELSRSIMRSGAKPKKLKVKQDSVLVEQGKPGDELFLLLDGVLSVEVDGEKVAEVGPGAILGERAIIEGGARTSTLRGLTECRVVSIPGDRIDRTALEEVAKGHRRERR